MDNLIELFAFDSSFIIEIDVAECFLKFVIISEIEPYPIMI